MDVQRELEQYERTGERGASLVEYCILVAMIAMATIGSVRLLGSRLANGDGSQNHTVNYLSLSEAVEAAGSYNPPS